MQASRWLPLHLSHQVALALIVAMAVLGTAHMLIRTWTYGAAVGFDATHYLATAENLAAGDGLRSFDGKPYVHWPPLFPMLLALFELAGMDAEEAGRWINAIAFGSIVLVSGIWLTRTLRSRSLALLGTFAVLIAYPLTDRSSYLMTEPLFILLTLMALLQMESFLKSGRQKPLLAGAVLFGLAAVTRYAGVIGLVTGLIIAFLRRAPNGARMKSALVFGAISSIPLTGVLIYNDMTAQRPIGDRSFASGQSILDSVRQILSVLDQWIIPFDQGLPWIFYLPISIIFLALVFLATCQRNCLLSRSISVIPFGLYVLFYFVMITVITPFTAGSSIDSRYLLPVYVPLTLMIFWWGDRMLCINRGKRMYTRVLISVVGIGFLIHSGVVIARTISDTSSALERGYENGMHNTMYWSESETLSWLEDNPVSGIVYSPSLDLVWYHSGTPAAEGRYRWSGEGFSDLVGRIQGGAAHVVLVAGGPIPEAEYADTFRFLPGVEVLGEFSDGGVYRFPARWRFDEAGYRANVNRYLNELTEESGELVGSGEFDVYVNGRTLVYIREPCAPADTEAWFFLHIDPDDPADLPDERQRWGFDGRDFIFDLQATRFDETCLTTVELPDYGIARIRTGQYDDTGQLWSVEFTLPD